MKNNIVKLLIIFSFCWLTSACSQPKTEQEAVSHAATLSPTEAEIYLKNYLSESPSSAAARAALGEALVKQGSYESALSQFDRITLPINARQRDYKIEALYMTSSYERILNMLETDPLPTGIVSNSAFVHALLQQQINSNVEPLTQLANIQTTAAIDTDLHNVIKLTSDFSSHLNQALFVSQLNEELNASATLQNNWLILNLLATTSFAVEKYDISVNAFEQYTAIRPKYLKTQLLKATALVYAKRMKEAKPLINKLLEVAPNQMLANQLNAYVAIYELDYESAKLYMERAIQNGFTTYQNFLFAAEVNFRIKNYEQTVYFIERAFANRPITEKYYNMALYATTATGTIEDTLDNLSTTNVDSKGHIETLGALVTGLQDIGNTSSLSELFDKLVAGPNLKPSEALDLALISGGNNSSNFADLGIDASKKVLENYYKDEVIIEPRVVNSAKSIIIANFVNNEKFELAHEQIAEWQGRKESDFNLLLDANVYNQQKQYSKTTELLSNKTDVFNNAAFYNTLAIAYSETDKPDSAVSTVEEGLLKYPFNLALLRLYGTIYREYDLNDMNFIKNLYSGGLLKDNIALSIFYGINNNFEEAHTVLLQLPESERNNVVFLHTLAEVYINLGDDNNALKTIEKVMRLQSMTLEEIKYALSTINRLGNNRLKIELLEKYSPRYSSNNDLKMSLVRAHLDNKDAKSANKVIRSFEIESAYFWSLKAEVAFNLGDLEQAELFYSRVHSRYPSDKTVIEYAQYLTLVNRQEEAISLLTDYIKSKPQSLNPILLLATYLEGNEAIVNYEKVLKINPNNLVALNNVAELYRDKGAYKLALPYAEKALALDPENAIISETVQTIKKAME